MPAGEAGPAPTPVATDSAIAVPGGIVLPGGNLKRRLHPGTFTRSACLKLSTPSTDPNSKAPPAGRQRGSPLTKTLAGLTSCGKVGGFMKTVRIIFLIALSVIALADAAFLS